MSTIEILKNFGVSFLQLFLQLVLPALVSAIAAYVIAWFSKRLKEATAHLSNNTQWAIEQAVKAAVLAAEQVHLKDAAINKKNYAIDKATDWLKQKGISVDLATLDTMIEAAVMQEFNKAKVTGVSPAVS